MKRNEKGVIPTVGSFFDNIWNRDDDFFQRFTKKAELPVVNVSETDNAFMLEIAAPGMKREDFKIEVADNSLIISSEIEEEKEESKKNYTSKEYTYKSFKRSFWMPENAEIENIEAKFKNGVLNIMIPKLEVEAKKTRTIDIR